VVPFNTCAEPLITPSAFNFVLTPVVNVADAVSIAISSAFTVIPLPAPTLIVRVVDISPPPVKPLPAVIETAVWSIC
jgi:hypothetical protein